GHGAPARGRWRLARDVRLDRLRPHGGRYILVQRNSPPAVGVRAGPADGPHRKSHPPAPPWHPRDTVCPRGRLLGGVAEPPHPPAGWFGPPPDPSEQEGLSGQQHSSRFGPPTRVLSHARTVHPLI